MTPNQSFRRGCAGAHGVCRLALGRSWPRPTTATPTTPCLPSADTATRRGLFTASPGRRPKTRAAASAASVLALGTLVVFSLSPHGRYLRLDAGPPQGRKALPKEQQPDWSQGGRDNNPASAKKEDGLAAATDAVSEWFHDAANADWTSIPDRIARLLPDWTKMLPGFARKLQSELDFVPGSLADEIWREAHDPAVHPEVQFAARVRVSDDLCDEEKAFRQHRQPVTAAALAKYLDLPPDQVHPDDVPVIAVCGSGGGLRALVAGTGSLMAASEAGLFDCVTYTAGVSGSCWLQALYFASFTHQDFRRVAEHLRARLGVHIAHPPELFALLTTAPTNKLLLSGPVERFKTDPETKFGLVDVYGTLLAARLLVPRAELTVSELDFKLSSQRRHLARGQNPMPIYTAVRHEIPGSREDGIPDAEPDEPAAQRGPWFQWFEITPYEFFCEEFAAGIPTWAMGRTFRGGQDVPLAASAAYANRDHYRLPEARMPLMLGIFGSAFCATLSHYYKEIRPVVQSLSGLAGVDEMIWGRSDDLSKVHPIEPATLPNPVYGMEPSQLPATVPRGLCQRPYIQLMDAGMSNNLPLYPFMRPGRGVEVVVVFDASADIRKDNWLSVADGYARRRGVKGWPVGVGWPPADEPPAKTAQQLQAAGAASREMAEDKLTQAKIDQAAHEIESGTSSMATSPGRGHEVPSEADQAKAAAKELGYCTVWVGSAGETVATAKEAAAAEDTARAAAREADHAAAHAPPIDESTQWRLTDPDAGLTLVYLPYLANEAKVPGVDPATSEFMSTWNFVYKPDEIDKAVALARANFAEGADQIRATVRAVYERKKQIRLAAEEQRRKDRLRWLVPAGETRKWGGQGGQGGQGGH